MVTGSGQPIEIKFPIHDTHLKKSLTILKRACFWALLAPICFYFLHNVPRKNKYRSFYTSYDPMDAFDRMKSGGYLSSCPKETKQDDKNGKKK